MKKTKPKAPIRILPSDGEYHVRKGIRKHLYVRNLAELRTFLYAAHR